MCAQEWSQGTWGTFPTVPGEPVPESRREGGWVVSDRVGARAGSEELLAPEICLWCESQGVFILSDVVWDVFSLGIWV